MTSPYTLFVQEEEVPVELEQEKAECFHQNLTLIIQFRHLC